MLLSVERPFAGAFAFLIPGATLQHCTGLVPQSCRRRLNMANGQSRFPRNLGDAVVSFRMRFPHILSTHRQSIPPSTVLNAKLPLAEYTVFAFLPFASATTRNDSVGMAVSLAFTLSFFSRSGYSCLQM